MRSRSNYNTNFVENNIYSYMENLNRFENKLIRLKTKDSTVNAKLKYLYSEIERLSSVNVLNDVFNISTKLEVATINDLKMGKLND